MNLKSEMAKRVGVAITLVSFWPLYDTTLKILALIVVAVLVMSCVVLLFRVRLMRSRLHRLVEASTFEVTFVALGLGMVTSGVRMVASSGLGWWEIATIAAGFLFIGAGIGENLVKLIPTTRRAAKIDRKTKETNISLELNLDGSGQWAIDTGIKMLDHLLAQVAQHGRFDLKIAASGDDQHHLVEDVALCLGRALTQALGEKQGIVRMADAAVPMDDALAMVAVDISGRGYAVLELSFSDNDMAGFATDLIRHFLESLAAEAKINLHARIIYGTNDHHKAEALFKALGRALDMATRIDQRIASQLPSTKELLEK